MSADTSANSATLGQRLLTLSERQVQKVNTIDLVIVKSVDLDTMRADVVLKRKVGGKVIKILGCPVFGLGSSTSSMISIPKDGDVMIIMYAKYELDEQLKRRDTQTINEMTFFDLNNAFLIGGVFSISTLPYDDIWSVSQNKDCKFTQKLLSNFTSENARSNIIYSSNFYDKTLASIKNPLRSKDTCKSWTDLNLKDDQAPIVTGEKYNTCSGLVVSEEEIMYKILKWSFPSDEFSYYNEDATNDAEKTVPIIANHPSCGDNPQKPCLSPIYYTTHEVVITGAGIEIYTRTPCERALIENDTTDKPVYPIVRTDLITQTGSTTIVKKLICKLNGVDTTCDTCYNLYKCSPPEMTDVPVFQMYMKEVADIPTKSWDERDNPDTEDSSSSSLKDTIFDEPTTYTSREETDSDYVKGTTTEETTMGMDWTADAQGSAYEVYIQSLIPYLETTTEQEALGDTDGRMFWTRRSEMVCNPVRARFKADRRINNGYATAEEGDTTKMVDSTIFSNVLDVYIDGAQEVTTSPEIGILCRRPDKYTKRFNAIYQSNISSIAASASILSINTTDPDGNYVITSATSNETCGFVNSVDRLVEVVKSASDLADVQSQDPQHMGHNNLYMKDEKGYVDVYARDEVSVKTDGDMYLTAKGDMVIEGENIFLNSVNTKIANSAGTMSQCCATVRKCLYNPRNIIGQSYAAPAASTLQQFTKGSQVYLSDALNNYLKMGNGKYEPVSLEDVIDAYNEKNGTSYEVTSDGITDGAGNSLNEAFNSLIYTSKDYMQSSESDSLDTDTSTYSILQKIVNGTASDYEYTEYTESLYNDAVSEYQTAVNTLYTKIEVYNKTLDAAATDGSSDWVTVGTAKNNLYTGYAACFGEADTSYLNYLKSVDDTFDPTYWFDDNGVAYLSDAYEESYVKTAVAELKSKSGDAYTSAKTQYTSLKSDFGETSD